jgi:hypothetical protein
MRSLAAASVLNKVPVNGAGSPSLTVATFSSAYETVEKNKILNTKKKHVT